VTDSQVYTNKKEEKCDEEEEKLEVDEAGLGFYGIANHCKMNENFKELIQKFGIKDRDMLAVQSLMADACQIQPKHLDAKSDPTNLENEDCLLLSKKDLCILQELVLLHSTVKSVACKHMVGVRRIRKIARLYNKRIRSIRKENRRVLNKKKKIDGDSVEILRDYLKKNQVLPITLEDMKRDLESRNPSIGTV
jgi:hypothetical protein